MGGRKKRYIERHAYCEKHEDEQEFEEIGGMRREAGHPVRTEKKNSRVRSSTSKLWLKHANIRYPHGSHDNSGNYAERDDVENEADEQPRCWANKGARED